MAGRDTGPINIKFMGWKSKAKKYVGLARQQMGRMVDLADKVGVTQIAWDREYPNVGVKIRTKQVTKLIKLAFISAIFEAAKDCVSIVEKVKKYFDEDVVIPFVANSQNVQVNDVTTDIPPPVYTDGNFFLYEDDSEIFQIVLKEGGSGGESKIFSSFNGIHSISKLGDPDALLCVDGRFGTAYHGEVSTIAVGGKTRRIDLTDYLGTVDFVGAPYEVGYAPAVLRKPTPPTDTRTADQKAAENARKWSWKDYGLYSREQAWSPIGSRNHVDGFSSNAGAAAEYSWIAFDDSGQGWRMRAEMEYFGNYGVPGAYLLFKIVLVGGYGELLGDNPVFDRTVAELTLPVAEMGTTNIGNIFYEYVYEALDNNMFVSPSDDGRAALINVYSGSEYGITCRASGQRPVRALLRVDITGTVSPVSGTGLDVTFVTQKSLFIPIAGPTYSIAYTNCEYIESTDRVIPIWEDACATSVNFEIDSSQSIKFRILHLLKGASPGVVVTYDLTVRWVYNKSGTMNRIVFGVDPNCSPEPINNWTGTYTDLLDDYRRLECSAGGVQDVDLSSPGSGSISWSTTSSLYPTDPVLRWPLLYFFSSAVWIGDCSITESFSNFKAIAYSGLTNSDSPGTDQQYKLPRYHPVENLFTDQENFWI